MSSETVERQSSWDPPAGWLRVRVSGVRFALPPGWVVEGSRGTVRAWNRRGDPDRALLLQNDPTTSSLRRHAALVVAAAEANGDRVVAESPEMLGGVPAVRAVLERYDGGTTVSYVAVHHGLGWDLRIIVAPLGDDDAVVEFERIVATFRFDVRRARVVHAPDVFGSGA